ncbi:EAL domain-containing protein [Rhodoferax saidenbachensis]|uniref:Diguanylate cyclase (GGDEF)-like protein/PAS domain S-box-containing protein n=1 Tax=Rhodoferax saidenbachensis TaxID=1484693 RepID=A0ABU1ZJF3_9BURK|nr:EAL domain-containing protein [Rhodoferax saidenbachensis]MDR7305508.1 diguanylate cyclase (GGDEF)-like protein/PAS domain S-box-containing protein [Rhodoferax saidenbachensis]
MKLDNARNRFIVIATSAYLVFALAWIFLSDQLLANFTDRSSLLWLSIAKGLLFVVSTAGMFFVALQAVPPVQPADDSSFIGSLDHGLAVLQAPRWMVYFFALLVTLLTVIVREGIAHGQSHRPMLILFMMPIILSALIGGLGPGLLSTVVSAVGAYWVFLEPLTSQTGTSSQNQIQWASLVANGVAVSLLSAVLRHSLHRAERQRRLLDGVVSGTSDAVFVKDRAGRYVLGNQATAQFIGKPLSWILGKDDTALFDTASGQHLMVLDKTIMEGGITQTHEETVKTHDGKSLVFLVTKGPVRDPDGSISGIFGVARDITERRRAKDLLRAREQQLARVIEGSDQGFWDWNLKTNDFHVSPRFETMLGYAPGEMDVSVEHWGDHVHPDDLAASMVSIQRHMDGQTDKHELDLRCKNKSGEWRWLHARGRIVEWDSDGKPLTMAGSHTDVTQQKAYELAQREASTVFECSYEGLMVVNADGLIAKVNPAFVRITGYAAEEVIGQSPRILSSGKQDTEFYRQMWGAIGKQDYWQGEIWNRRKSGEIYAELLSISVVRNSAGAVEHYVAVFSDISRLKEHEAELDRIAHYDPLTGVPNRRLLADRLAQAIARTARSDLSLAVCYLDLDGFKQVNDEYGHPGGDQLLIGVAEHLKRIMRAEDTLARLGGDEFVLLLADIASPEECSIILERVLAAASGPVQVDGRAVSVSASIGVSLYPQDHADADTLLRHADQAMYLAKNAGKNRFHLFDPESDRKAQQHRHYIDRVRLALEQGELVLHYQPKVDLRDGRLVGVEALVRWQHPEKGLLPPSEFLPHIQGSNLEQPLGEWVIRTALAQATQWLQDGLQLQMGVNISASHLVQVDFCDKLAAALSVQPQLPPESLELEVLETAAFEDINAAGAVLRRCQALGVRFALDDFGTGYSSLTYLRKLPVDTLKIDQSFVRHMLTDSEDRGIVESVIRLASAFNREVIAEGVETLDIGAALLGMGCHLAQGYGVAKPMPAAALAPWAAQWRQQARWRDLATIAGEATGP